MLFSPTSRTLWDRDGRLLKRLSCSKGASADDLRALLTEFNAFGLRSPASDQHEAAIDWLADELAARLS